MWVNQMSKYLSTTKAGLALVAAVGLIGMVGCSSSKVGVNGVVSQMASKTQNLILPGMTLHWVKGTYNNCLQHANTDEWSVATSAFSGTLPAPLAEVVNGDTACSLRVTAMTFDNTLVYDLNLLDSPMSLTDGFFSIGKKFERVAGSPSVIYANMKLDSIAYTSNMTLSVVYSTDIQLVSQDVTATYATVQLTAINSVGVPVPSPDYTISTTGLTLKVGADNKIVSAIGTVDLTQLLSGQVAEDYMVMTPAMLSNPGDYNTVHTAYTIPVSFAGVLQVSAYDLGLQSGVDLTSTLDVYVVLRHTQSGVSSYTVVNLNFLAP